MHSKLAIKKYCEFREQFSLKQYNTYSEPSARSSFSLASKFLDITFTRDQYTFSHISTNRAINKKNMAETL